MIPYNMSGWQQPKGKPTARYLDPIPLGGTFLFNHHDVMSTGRMPAIRNVDEEKKQERTALRETITHICTQVLDLVRDALQDATPDTWQEFWLEHSIEYREQMDLLGGLVKRLGLEKFFLVSEPDHPRCREVAERFPDAARELHFIRGLVANASTRAAGFAKVPVSEDKRAEDFDAAGRFGYYGTFFGICMTTLDLLTTDREIRVSTALVDTILGVARSCAIEFNHAVMEGRALRRETTPGTSSVYPIVSRTATEDDHDDPIADDLPLAEAAIRALEAKV